MCLIACKYLPNLGWVGVKNDDKNYKPSLKVKKSYRTETERLMVWDELSKYTEGLNEHGVAILSSPVGSRDEYYQVKKTRKEKRYYSPSGFVIRKALLEKTPEEAIQALIASGVDGCTVVFNEHNCYILEMSLDLADKGEKEYYRVYEASPTDLVLRTNHGLFLNGLGYDDPAKKESSQKRYDYFSDRMPNIQTIDDLLDVASCDNIDNDRQNNPFRIATNRKDLRTVSQLILAPKTKTMHLRPIWAKTSFDLDSLNQEANLTFFEIVSTRKLMTMRQALGRM